MSTTVLVPLILGPAAAIVGALAHVVWRLGRQAERIDHLEETMEDMRGDIKWLTRGRPQ